jgi:hypothetical protein
VTVSLHRSADTRIEDRSRVFTVLRQGTDLGILTLFFHHHRGDRRDMLPAVPVHFEFPDLHLKAQQRR